MKYLKTYESIRDAMKPRSHEDIIKSLGDSGMPMDAILMKGVEENEIWLVQYALDNGANIHTGYMEHMRTKDNDLPLIWSVEQGNIPMVKFLLKNGADVNADDRAPIATAASLVGPKKAIAMIKVLIEAGADVSAKDNAAYRTAKMYGEKEIMDFLEPYMNKTNESVRGMMKPKEDEDIEKSMMNLSPDELLSKSVKSGYLKGVKIAIEKGADIHWENDYALRLCAWNGHYEIAKYLIENGAYVRALENDALDKATFEGYIDIVKLLLDNGAVINTWGTYCPLTAASRSGWLDIVKLLLTYKDKVDFRYDAAIQAAKESQESNYYEKRPQSDEIIKLLTPYMEEKIKEKQTKTYESIRGAMKPKSEEEVIKHMKRFDPDTKLISGCNQGLLYLVKLAIEEGADIHKHGELALRYAMREGHQDIIDYLISKSADRERVENSMFRMKTNESIRDMIKPKNKNENMKTKYNDFLRESYEPVPDDYKYFKRQITNSNQPKEELINDLIDNRNEWIQSLMRTARSHWELGDGKKNEFPEKVYFKVIDEVIDEVIAER